MCLHQLPQSLLLRTGFLSPPPALPSSQVGPGLQLQWPPEPSPGLILLRYLPGPATSLLRALLTPHFQDKTHTPHMNPLTPTPHPPLPPRPNPNSTAVHSRPFTSWWWEVDPYFLRIKKSECPEVWGRLATRSFSHGQQVGLQQNTSSLPVCRSVYSNR